MNPVPQPRAALNSYTAHLYVYSWRCNHRTPPPRDLPRTPPKPLPPSYPHTVPSPLYPGEELTTPTHHTRCLHTRPGPHHLVVLFLHTHSFPWQTHHCTPPRNDQRLCEYRRDTKDRESQSVLWPSLAPSSVGLRYCPHSPSHHETRLLDEVHGWPSGRRRKGVVVVVAAARFDTRICNTLTW